MSYLPSSFSRHRSATQVPGRRSSEDVDDDDLAFGKKENGLSSFKSSSKRERDWDPVSNGTSHASSSERASASTRTTIPSSSTGHAAFVRSKSTPHASSNASNVALPTTVGSSSAATTTNSIEPPSRLPGAANTRLRQIRGLPTKSLKSSSPVQLHSPHLTPILSRAGSSVLSTLDSPLLSNPPSPREPDIPRPSSRVSDLSDLSLLDDGPELQKKIAARGQKRQFVHDIDARLAEGDRIPQVELDVYQELKRVAGAEEEMREKYGQFFSAAGPEAEWERLETPLWDQYMERKEALEQQASTVPTNVDYVDTDWEGGVEADENQDAQQESYSPLEPRSSSRLDSVRNSRDIQHYDYRSSNAQHSQYRGASTSHAGTRTSSRQEAYVDVDWEQEQQDEEEEDYGQTARTHLRARTMSPPPLAPRSTSSLGQALTELNGPRNTTSSVRASIPSDEDPEVLRERERVKLKRDASNKEREARRTRAGLDSAHPSRIGHVRKESETVRNGVANPTLSTSGGPTIKSLRTPRANPAAVPTASESEERRRRKPEQDSGNEQPVGRPYSKSVGERTAGVVPSGHHRSQSARRPETQARQQQEYQEDDQGYENGYGGQAQAHSQPVQQHVASNGHGLQRSTTAPATVVNDPHTPGASTSGRSGSTNFHVGKHSYVRLDTLGKGGSSRVFRVMRTADQAFFALKRVALDKTDAETVRGYRNEIQLLKRLAGNPNIIQLFDHDTRGKGQGTLYMIMELGEIDFAKLLQERQGSPVRPHWIASHWEEMLEAVLVIHEEKIVHSDLKPANFVMVKGRLKLIDFGIANAIANDTTNIQREGQVGTVNYMSPEALEAPDGAARHRIGRASDVWSLGIILYQMVYGAPPFQALNMHQKMRAIPDPNFVIQYPDVSIPTVPASRTTDGQPIPRPEFAWKVPQCFLETIQTCLRRDPKSRATIPELLADPWVKQIQESAPAAPPQPAPKFKLRDDEVIINKHYMDQLISHVMKTTLDQARVSYAVDDRHFQRVDALSEEIMQQLKLITDPQ